jgi:hypothetical protein
MKRLNSAAFIIQTAWRRIYVSADRGGIALEARSWSDRDSSFLNSSVGYTATIVISYFSAREVIQSACSDLLIRARPS